MPFSTANPVAIVYVGEALLMLLGMAFISVILYSHHQKLKLQESKLQAVQKSEENYRALFHHSLAGMLKFTFGKFEILDANEALLELFSCDSLSNLSETLLTAIPEELQFILDALEERGILEEHEVSFRDKSGSLRWILISVKSGNGKNIAYGVVRDITRRKVDQEKIEEQAALLNRTRDSVIVLTLDGEILFWNNAACDIYGWDASETMGKNIRDLCIYESLQYQAAMEDASHFGEWSGEQTHLTRSHQSILVESSWQRIDNHFTKIATLLVVTTDITDKRALELSSVYNQKMEAIALMTSGIAHDLQNILAPMALSVNILRGKISDHTGTMVLSKLEDSTLSGLHLVKNILLVGRGISGVKRPVELASILEGALKTAVHAMGENLVLEKRFVKQPFKVQADESQLLQVFLNLFQNAKDAMPEGGRLSVLLRMNEESAFDSEGSEGEYSGECINQVLVEISDTGQGIPPELLDKVFDPFFTTKEGAGGTGLGLPIVKNIIRNHGGDISVRSTVSEGTTFSVLLPLCVPEENERHA